jgi:anionic cell wall polymer biosynthesis LytR-Cps2A-Psr (LCP) family protein
MRSATVWEKIKSTARKNGIELTFDTIKALAGVVIKQMLG